MTTIDVVKLEDKYVSGYRARYAPPEILEEGHSFEGYTLETFSTLEEVEKYYQGNYTLLVIL